MLYLLDTNICIYIIKEHPLTVKKRFVKFHPGDLGISSITLSELYYGVDKSVNRTKNLDALHKFILPLEIAKFDEQAALYYGDIRATLEKSGKIIGPLDLLIAAHALSLDVTLITNNEKEFKRVKNLTVENWT